MGGIWMNNHDLADSLAEVVGFKAGLALSRARTAAMLKAYDAKLAERLLWPDARMMRVESTTYQEAATYLLYKVGYVATPTVLPPVGGVYHRYKADPVRGKLTAPIGEMLVEWMDAALSAPAPASGLDPTPFMKRAAETFGAPGLDVAMAYLRGIDVIQQVNPWTRIRRTDWADTRQLEDLFKSENLDTLYGKFFDQRFIDYIARNFDEEIDDVHWRQFEALTAEHFEKQGFRAELGPGRNDDGIDVRVFPKDDNPSLPPLIIVQCKREKRKIGKTLLKSVYADVLWEKAGSGLIVTTTELSPGTDDMRQARAYPVEAIDRGKLRDWVLAMRTAPT